jgi:hypothetical protein
MERSACTLALGFIKTFNELEPVALILLAAHLPVQIKLQPTMLSIFCAELLKPSHFDFI